jgi:hypothetical protein
MGGVERELFPASHNPSIIIIMMTTRTYLVGLMACTRHGGVIGRSGKIPWRIPAEFAHFQRTTDGGVVVLGYSLSLS